MNQDQTKQCPFCGETILAVAIKCKHCRSMIGDSTTDEVKDGQVALGDESAVGEVDVAKPLNKEELPLSTKIVAMTVGVLLILYAVGLAVVGVPILIVLISDGPLWLILVMLPLALAWLIWPLVAGVGLVKLKPWGYVSTTSFLWWSAVMSIFGAVKEWDGSYLLGLILPCIVYSLLEPHKRYFGIMEPPEKDGQSDLTEPPPAAKKLNFLERLNEKLKRKVSRPLYWLIVVLMLTVVWPVLVFLLIGLIGGLVGIGIAIFS